MTCSAKSSQFATTATATIQTESNVRKMARLIYACLAIASISIHPWKLPQVFDQEPPTIHPHVFSLIACWPSDADEPVVTEINLDAVLRNQNQFPLTGLKTADEWVEYSQGKGQGFERYRIVSTESGRFVVEYHSNTGGTLTAVATIEFMISERTFQQRGKTRTCRVLRVLSCHRD